MAALVDLAQLLEGPGTARSSRRPCRRTPRGTAVEQAHVGHSGDNLVRKAVFGIVFGRYRRDHALREFTDRLRQLGILIGQIARRWR